MEMLIVVLMVIGGVSVFRVAGNLGTWWMTGVWVPSGIRTTKSAKATPVAVDSNDVSKEVAQPAKVKVAHVVADTIEVVRLPKGAYCHVRFYLDQGYATRTLRANGERIELPKLSLKGEATSRDILAATRLECLDVLKERTQPAAKQKKASSNAAPKIAQVVFEQVQEATEAAAPAAAETASETKQPKKTITQKVVASEGAKVERQVFGVLVAHGQAQYPFTREGEKPSKSYYAKLRNAKGNEFDVWGVDIERAIEEGEVQEGQKICLTKYGKTQVKIVETVTRADGTVDSVERTALKNLWSAQAVK